MMYCGNCGAMLADNAQVCGNCGVPIAPIPQATYSDPAAASTNSQGVNFDFGTNTASAVSSKRYQYKVLSQKDKWFSGKFDPLTLEQAMNAYADQGWRVIGCATADIASGFGAARQEFITVLEREV